MRGAGEAGAHKMEVTHHSSVHDFAHSQLPRNSVCFCGCMLLVVKLTGEHLNQVLTILHPAKLHESNSTFLSETPLVRVHPSSWDQLGPLWNYHKRLSFAGPSSSHPLGPARTPPKFSTTSEQVVFCRRLPWSEFIPPPGTSSDPSGIITSV